MHKNIQVAQKSKPLPNHKKSV